MLRLDSPRAFAVILGVLTIGACAMQAPAPVAPEVFQREIAAPKGRVLMAATRVFAEHGATIAASDTAVGMVQSHPLTLTGTWESERVSERVDCGKDMVGVEYAGNNPVTITLSVLVDSLTGGTRARLKATASTHDQVARSMASSNPVAAGLSSDRGCTLTAAFATKLLDEIQAIATR